MLLALVVLAVLVGNEAVVAVLQHLLAQQVL
jgi:hypothetical protein